MCTQNIVCRTCLCSIWLVCIRHTFSSLLYVNRVKELLPATRCGDIIFDATNWIGDVCVYVCAYECIASFRSDELPVDFASEIRADEIVETDNGSRIDSRRLLHVMDVFMNAVN